MSEGEAEEKALGVATVLPSGVALALARAAELAKQFPEDSLKRKEIIEEAIEKAKRTAPSYFSNTHRP